jgi:hypothetical protein
MVIDMIDPPKDKEQHSAEIYKNPYNQAAHADQSTATLSPH